MSCFYLAATDRDRRARATKVGLRPVQSGSKQARVTLHEPRCSAPASEAESSGPRPAHAREEAAEQRALEVPLDTASAFRRYASYVAAIGVRVLGRRGEIDDFVQDVFLSAHRSIAHVRDPQALKGWLATLAVREAVRRLRRQRLKEWLGMRATPDYADVADTAASAEERALLASVFAALDKLPTAERVAWALRYLEGETMERVAVLCGCSLSTAKRRVTSAEQALEKLGVGRV